MPSWSTTVWSRFTHTRPVRPPPRPPSLNRDNAPGDEKGRQPALPPLVFLPTDRYCFAGIVTGSCVTASITEAEVRMFLPATTVTDAKPQPTFGAWARAVNGSMS